MTEMPNDRDSRHAMAEKAAALVKAYRQGDPDALGELVEMYKRPLFAFILRMMETQSEADDVFQDVWFRAIKNMRTYQHKNFMSWLFRIAHNIIIDRARHRKVEGWADPPTARNDEEAHWAQMLPSPKPGPDRVIIAQEMGRQIQAALAELPPEQREVFLLRMEADMPFREIARLQDASINTVLARMHYALQKIRKKLADLKETVS